MSKAMYKTATAVHKILQKLTRANISSDLLCVLLLVLLLLGIILLLLLGLLVLTEGLPLLCKLIGISNIIANNDVIEDGASLHLPQIKADEAKVCIFVDGIVVLILGIVDFLGLPEALVSGIGDALDAPVTLVLWIVLHGCLPLTVLLIIPIVRLLRLRIHLYKWEVPSPSCLYSRSDFFKTFLPL